MSKRSNEKRVTKASRAIRFLREQSGISLREAANQAGLGFSVVAHLETGRIGVGANHLERLLPIYKATFQTYEMFASGSVELPREPRKECIEIIQKMTNVQLLTAMPILKSLDNHK